MAADPGDSPPDSLEPAPAEPTPDLTGQVIAGRYKVLKRLAEGGMSRVFQAEQLDLKRVVAVKVLKRPADLRGEAEKIDWTKRFEREAAVLATLSHPNIVVIHEFGVTDDGLAYLAMEYIEGETLSSHVRTHGPLDGPAAVRVASQIASALEDAHTSGSIHRDLKPQNIMLVRGKTTRVKVLDFGIVKSRAADDDGEKTQEGIRVGSPRYMAPEQVSGDPVSPATDVYALGCLLFYMLTGKPPFAHKNMFEVMAAQLKDAPPSLKSVHPAVQASAELEALLRRTLEKNPAQRFAEMESLLAALAKCPESTGEVARAAPLESAPPPSSASAPSLSASLADSDAPSKQRAWALVALACVVLAGVIAVVWRSRTPDAVAENAEDADPHGAEPAGTDVPAPTDIPPPSATSVASSPSELDVGRPDAATPEAVPTAEGPTRDPRRSERRREDVAEPTPPVETPPAEPRHTVVEEERPAPTERALPSDNLDPWSN